MNQEILEAMTIDISKLREAAERATPGKWKTLELPEPSESSYFDIKMEDGTSAEVTFYDLNYMELANPQTILALLKEREILREALGFLAHYNSFAGASTMAESARNSLASADTILRQESET